MYKLFWFSNTNTLYKVECEISDLKFGAVSKISVTRLEHGTSALVVIFSKPLWDIPTNET